MRVTIEHRDEAAGVIGTKRNYFLDCCVDFSEAEQALIRERGLQKHHVTVDDVLPITPNVQDVKRSYTLKMAIAAGVSLVGILWAGIVKGSLQVWGPLMFVSGAGYAVYSLYRYLVPPYAPMDALRLDFLLKHRRFSIRVGSPTQSKEMEQEVYNSLQSVKEFMEGSVELGSARTVEF